MRMMAKGQPFEHIEADGQNAPVFSESFLYDTVGKGDARFILAVAEEYTHVIEAIGPSALVSLLDVKPRLVQRLGLGEKIVEWLADAVSDETRYREERNPSQVIVDEKAAEQIWEMLHEEYRTFFVPEDDMDKDRLRLYLKLTEDLGEWSKGQHEKAKASKADGKERKAAKTEKVKAERARKIKLRETREAVAAALREKDPENAALREYAETYGELAFPPD